MPRKAYSDQEREQIKENLLATAIRLIVERGLIHSSVDLLCKKVGISKTFFYTLFSSKEDLVLQALRHQQPHLLSRAQALMDDPAPTWRQAAEQFLRAVEAEYGFAVTGHSFEIIGLCPDCRKKEEK